MKLFAAALVLVPCLTRYQLGWLDCARVRSPLQDPRHQWLEVGDREQDPDPALGRAFDLLRRVPSARLDETGLLAAELDDHPSGLGGVADVDPEGAVQHFVDLEVGWHVEGTLAKVVGFGEALHG